MTGRKILSGISVISGIPEKAPRDSVFLSHWDTAKYRSMVVYVFWQERSRDGY